MRSSAMTGPAPRIVVTLQAISRRADPEQATARNEAYLERLRRAGADPVPLDEHATPEERAVALEQMDGLLLSGGTDLHPALYGREIDGAVDIEQERDALELEAWTEARRRNVPVLGICRGFQAVNVFSGGTLVQHVEGHRSPPFPAPDVNRHPFRLHAGSRLARILRPHDPGRGVLSVNTYHHQAVRREDVAPGLLASATSPASDGELVEGLESEDPASFVLAVQCHPERVESTPPEFDRLWTVFVDAARASRT